MKSKVLTLILATFFSATFLGGAPAFAETKGDKAGKDLSKKMGKRGPRKERDTMVSQLNLTEKQQKEIKKIRESHKNKTETKRNAVRKAKEDLDNAMTGKAKQKDLLKKFNVLQDARADVARLSFEKMLAVREVMTPEQRTKFHDMRKKKDRRRGRHARRFQGKQKGDTPKKK